MPIAKRRVQEMAKWPRDEATSRHAGEEEAWQGHLRSSVALFDYNPHSAVPAPRGLSSSSLLEELPNENEKGTLCRVILFTTASHTQRCFGLETGDARHHQRWPQCPVGQTSWDVACSMQGQLSSGETTIGMEAKHWTRRGTGGSPQANTA